MTILETERLSICQLTTKDAGFILELLNTPGYLQYIGDRGVRTIEGAENYIISGPVKSYAAFGFGLYLVKLKSSGTSIGMCGPIKRDNLEYVDIGFAFLPGFEGKGYGFECASAIMNYAKTTLQLKNIAGITLENNIPSIKLLEKLGLRFKKKIMFGDEELLLYLHEFL